MHTSAYTHRLGVAAPRERVFDAIATVTGVREWWTPIVTGNASRLQLGFEGLDELIVLRVASSTPPGLLRWECLEHSGAPDWAGSTITFELTAAVSHASAIAFSHDGVPAELVAAGWERFLPSLAAFAETGTGAPFGSDALALAQRYHRAWTAHDFAAAAACLDDDLETDVPLNEYATKDAWVEALTSFGSLVEGTDVLAAFGNDREALLLYDMTTAPFGALRIAEHFVVRDGRIACIRHVHDTAALRAPGAV
jgi:uncharacterized protein YndB with AHSA1/START domain